MKLLVRARDGLQKGCYWCAKPFDSLEDATLEHVVPLADGGLHELGNCALACEECNLLNVPRSVTQAIEAAAMCRENRAEANRIANGGKAEHGLPEDCSKEISSRFPAIKREAGAKFMDFAKASFFLRKIHAQLRKPPPSKHERRVFKGHFNRWLSEAGINAPEEYPAGYRSPFA